jgi:hypothetical protein
MPGEHGQCFQVRFSHKFVSKRVPIQNTHAQLTVSSYGCGGTDEVDGVVGWDTDGLDVAPVAGAGLGFREPGVADGDVDGEAGTLARWTNGCAA